ncbi:MAG: carboxypeptidase-like regulatory domain-containing protein, partial [Bryobacteraceae bacterium]
MPLRKYGCFIALLGLLFFALANFVPAIDAQVYTGSLTGVVTDPSGAIVPGAKIALVDQDKGF